MPKVRVNKLGLRFPIRIEYGSLQTVGYPQKYGNELALFCSTVKGERVWLKDWGLPDVIHQPIIDNGTLETIILTNVRQYFPEGRFRVVCQDDSGQLGRKICQLDYQIDEEIGFIDIEI